MKALVVEDEVIIRTGIVKKVNWDMFEISQVFEAENGEKGYEIIINEKPDIVILDINMPKLNGIELLERIRDEGIKSHVIILSGHDNFSYAQQAIKYEVDNYLLKPCSTKQIEETLQKVCTIISTSSEKERKYEEMKKKFDDMAPFLKSGLINSIITGNISDEAEIIHLCQYFEINILNECFIVAVVLLEDKFTGSASPEESLINKVEICQIINDVVSCDNIIIDSSLSGRVLLLASGDNERELKKDFFEIIDDIVNAASGKTSTKLAVGIGNISRGIKNIKDSYNSALMALENRFVQDDSRVFFIEDIILCNKVLVNYPYDDEKHFLACLKSGVRDSSTDSLNKLIFFLKSKKDKYPVNLIKIHLKQLVYYMMQVVYEIGGDVSDLYGNVNILEQIEAFYHIDEYQDFLFGFTEKLCEYISKKRYLKNNSVIRKVITFIEQNYSNESLSLGQIADYVGMHPNYVSHLFKKEKGESLASYLCKFRIKMAEKLILKSDCFKIYDIAYEVGFSDAHYFTTCFKSIIGVTPSEYKQFRKN